MNPAPAKFVTNWYEKKSCGDKKHDAEMKQQHYVSKQANHLYLKWKPNRISILCFLSTFMCIRTHQFAHEASDRKNHLFWENFWSVSSTARYPHLWSAWSAYLALQIRRYNPLKDFHHILFWMVLLSCSSFLNLNDYHFFYSHWYLQKKIMFSCNKNCF